MKYVPSSIAQADLDVSQAPYFGGEFAVYLSRVASYRVGVVDTTSSGTGTAANATYTATAGITLPVAGADLQLALTTELRSAVPLVVVFACLNETSVVTTVTFTFATPARVSDLSSNFPRGYAVDGVVAIGSKVKSITSLTGVTGGDRNQRFTLYQLPEATDYVLVGSSTEKSFNTKSRKPVGIDQGMESDAFVKRGKTGKGECTIDSKFGTMVDRLIRFDGTKTTCMMVGIKEGQVTNDRLVFTQFVPGVTVDLPDGEGEAVEKAASCKYVDQLFFVAP